MMNTILSIYWTLSSLLNIIILSLSNTILCIYGPSSSAYFEHYPLYIVNTILSLLNTILSFFWTPSSLYWTPFFLFIEYNLFSLSNIIFSLYWRPSSLFIEHHPLFLLNTILSLKWTPHQIWQCKGMMTLQLNQSFTRVLEGEICFLALQTQSSTQIYNQILSLYTYMFFQHISRLGSVFVVFSTSPLST